MKECLRHHCVLLLVQPICFCPRGKYKTLLLKIDKGAVSIFIGDAAICVGAFSKTVGVVAISVKLFLHLCDLSLVSFASV